MTRSPSPSRAIRRGLMAALMGVVLAGCGAASPSVEPTDEPEPLVADPAEGQLAEGWRATLVVSVVPQWEPGPGGTPMTDDWGEHPQLLEAPAAVHVVDGPVEIGGESWLKVYVLPNPSRAPSDFFAWLPASVEGQPSLEQDAVEDCPIAELPAIAALTPPDRASCFEDQPITLDGRSWFPQHWVSYRLEPDWFGSSEGTLTTMSLVATAGAPGFPDFGAPLLEMQVPPDVPRPPLDFQLRVTGRFNHPDAEDCRRTRLRAGMLPAPPPRSGLPDERPEDSRAWCRWRFVIDEWRILRGPEGRAVRPGDVQLHRTSAGDGLCGGVGMPPLTFRIDPREPDPIWLEAVVEGHRILPFFGAGFRAAFTPELVVLGPGGEVVARDGLTFNPEEDLLGYALCAMGNIVTIEER